jgi:hypothetical protein
LGGLVAVAAVLVLTAPAMAQRSRGTGDPLGLIASGAVIPYIGDGLINPGGMSFIELASPVGDNSGASSGGVGGLHAFFYSTSCVKGPASLGIPLTTNDFIIKRIDNIDKNPSEGLIALGAVDESGFFLEPFESPIHAHMFWFDTLTDNVRMMEPIGLAHFENGQVWNPLRTGATFVAPLEGAQVGGQAGANTALLLICPTRSITSGSATSAFPTGNGFPLLEPPSDPTISPSIKARIYGNNERFLRDATTNCSCLTALPIIAITGASDVYNDAANATFGTYTELEGNQGANVTPVPPVCNLTQTGPGNGNGDCRVFAISGGACSAAQLAAGATGPAGDQDVCRQFLIVTPGQPGGGTSWVSFTGYRGILQNNRDAFSRLNNGNAGLLRGGNILPPNGR